jgi:endoglucanase
VQTQSVLCLLLVAALASSCAPAILVHNRPLGRAAKVGVPEARLARLAKGANITRWFWLLNETHHDPAHYLEESDLKQIAALGLRSVRLAVDPAYILDRAHPAVPLPAVQNLDRAIEALIQADVMVVLELQDDSKVAWETEPSYVDAIMMLWAALADRYVKHSPDNLLFEVVNEPRFEAAPGAWQPLAERWVKVMRAHAPLHTLALGGPRWGGLDGLELLAPVSDKNVVYSFHFYEPFAFTHQGATWAGPDVITLRNVPYPYVKSQCDAAALAQEDEAARSKVRAYCDEHWDAAKIGSSLSRASTWGKKYGVPVWMGEFGAICTAPRDARSAWLRDTRLAAEALAIPWTLWGYDDCFGLDRKTEAPTAPGAVARAPRLDQDAIRALGL